MSEATACPISARKCCSVIQQYSNPDCSAATAWVNAFQYASRSDVGFQGRGIYRVPDGGAEIGGAATGPATGAQ